MGMFLKFVEDNFFKQSCFFKELAFSYKYVEADDTCNQFKASTLYYFLRNGSSIIENTMKSMLSGLVKVFLQFIR